MEILVATKNPHKLREISQILRGLPLTAYSLQLKETGKTFEENAIKKAKAVAKKTGKIALADDSGLMVDCLDGAPGVRSARFVYPPTSLNLCHKLLRKMQLVGCRKRSAKFVCTIALAYPDGKIKTFRGEVRGKITYEMQGSHGFGYDPVFIPSGYKKTFAEMKPATKNRLSHRAKALKKLANYLQKK